MINGKCIIRSHGGLTSFSLKGFPLRHGFFARSGGKSSAPYTSLNTAYITKDPDAPLNRELLFRSLGIGHQAIRILNPCHGDRIVFEDMSCAEADNIAKVLIKTDAAFTRQPDTHFLVSTADCIPALFTDDDLSFAGVMHLGWRNLVTDFTEKVIGALLENYGVSPESLRVGIGPLIYPCCYVFKEPVQKDDPFWQPFLRDCGDGNCGIDLASAFKAKLTRCGIPAEKIAESGICTACENKFFFSCYKEGYVSGRFPTLLSFQSI
jgi:copper oxidase (laccase) domain-containing protein